ncbi:MAG: hypothetical protein ACF8TS_12875 [Maioricimonas sp. JB049]
MGEAKQPVWQGASIVALGAFNPKIFHPEWFARTELVRLSEAQDAKVSVVSTEFTFVEFERFRLQVTDRRFSVETHDPRMYHPLRDLVAGTFSVLEHTPINAFGFNSKRTFPLAPESSWREFSGRLAPERNWTGILLEPSVNVLTVRGTREECDADRIQISIHPDGEKNQVVAISFNEHYDVSGDTGQVADLPVDAFVLRLKDSWEDFLKYSDAAAKQLVDDDQNGPTP